MIGTDSAISHPLERGEWSVTRANEKNISYYKPKASLILST